MDEVTGYWRKLHNEELHNLYSSPNIIRMIKSWRIKWAEHVEHMGGRKRLQEFGRPRRRWEDNTKMDIWEIVVGVWI
jgi:hypothetical protein